MRFILNLLIDPVFLWILCMAVGGILWLRHRRKPARRFFWAGGLWLVLIGVTPLSTWLAVGLEYRYPVWHPSQVPSDSKKSIHIVVLGGGMTSGEDVTPADQLSGDALNRIVEGVRIKHLVPRARLVTSGFSIRSVRSQAEILAASAVDLGVAPSDTLCLSDPRTTREEAAAYRARFDDGATIILVTSAMHLPRAMGWFRHNGLDPIPAPANHLVKISPDQWTYDWWPSPQKITRMRRVCHEYAGLAELEWVRRSR